MGEEEDLRWNTGEEEKEEKPPSKFDGYPKYTFDRDHSVRIRIFDFNEEIECVGVEDEPHSADAHYANWLENTSTDFENIGSDTNNKYTLKHIEPHPKNKDMLIHYYEADTHLTIEKLKLELGKLIGFLIVVASIVWFISIIPWKAIFGFILIIIQEIFS